MFISVLSAQVICYAMTGLGAGYLLFDTTKGVYKHFIKRRK